jgi:hypothetical protein
VRVAKGSLLSPLTMTLDVVEGQHGTSHLGIDWSSRVWWLHVGSFIVV